MYKNEGSLFTSDGLKKTNARMNMWKHKAGIGPWLAIRCEFLKKKKK